MLDAIGSKVVSQTPWCSFIAPLFGAICQSCERVATEMARNLARSVASIIPVPGARSLVSATQRISTLGHASQVVEAVSGDRSSDDANSGCVQLTQNPTCIERSP